MAIKLKKHKRNPEYTYLDPERSGVNRVADRLRANSRDTAKIAAGMLLAISGASLAPTDNSSEQVVPASELVPHTHESSHHQMKPINFEPDIGTVLPGNSPNNK